ncbi:MAG: hypothetical protein K1Y02_24590 [Candidatus Hydrogenedentes bacterium]|nr:hypothetical protein [Candidatus Hydrogenedentota bacterium]
MSRDLNPADEPPIDTSLAHYLEERALAIAGEKARTEEERAAVSRLLAFRQSLMTDREAFSEESVRKRHARGEIYSPARVAVINSYCPSRESLDDEVKKKYLRQSDFAGVLKAYARVHFGTALVSMRSIVSAMPKDIIDSARRMQQLEESFANAWLSAIGDENFTAEVRELQREATVLFRTASRPIYLVADSVAVVMSDEDAYVLGKAWNKLDALAEALAIPSLSAFIAFEEEGVSAGTPASEILTAVEALIAGVERNVERMPSKKRVLSTLQTTRAALIECEKVGGSAFFEVDI